MNSARPEVLAVDVRGPSLAGPADEAAEGWGCASELTDRDFAIAPEGQIPRNAGVKGQWVQSQTDLNESLVLLGRIAGGDSSAFWVLWQRYQKFLFAVCLRDMGMHADAEDALSRAMLKARDRLPRHASAVMNPRAWLARLTHNVCMEMHREHTRRKVHVETASRSAGDLDGAGQFVPSPEETLLREEATGVLAGTINEMPPRLKEPLLLRYWHEVPSRQVADRLALSTDNVRKRIQQARSVLRGRLQGYLSGDSTPPAYIGAVRQLHNGGSTPNSHALVLAEQTGRREEINDTAGSPPEFWPVTVTMRSGERKDTFILLRRRPNRLNLKLRTLKRYVEDHPRGWKKRLETAALLYAMGDWEEAVQHYRHVVKKQPRLIEVWMKLANLLRLTDREEESAAAYRRALALAKTPCLEYEIQGLIDLCERDYAGAAACLERAAMMESSNAMRWRDSGLAHLAAGNLGKAVSSFDKALQMDPDNAVALTMSYDALLGTGNLDDAYWRLSRAIQVDPNCVPALKRMAAHRCAAGLVRGVEGTTTRNLLRKIRRLAPDRSDFDELMALYQWRSAQSAPPLNRVCHFSQRFACEPDRRFASRLLGTVDG